MLMSPPKTVYQVQGLAVHTKGLGGCAFQVVLCPEFARECREFNALSEHIEIIQNKCRLVAQSYGSGPDGLYYQPPYMEKGLLVQFFTALGNACDIGIPGNKLPVSCNEPVIYLMVLS